MLSNGSGSSRSYFYYLQVFAEGTHIMVPWFERPIVYDVRARPSVIQSASGSKDLQTVRGDFPVNTAFITLCACRTTAHGSHPRVCGRFRCVGERGPACADEAQP